MTKRLEIEENVKILTAAVHNSLQDRCDSDEDSKSFLPAGVALPLKTAQEVTALEAQLQKEQTWQEKMLS